MQKFISTLTVRGRKLSCLSQSFKLVGWILWGGGRGFGG